MLDLDMVFDDDRPPGAAVLTISPSALVATDGGYLAPADMPEAWRERFAERAAIREYDGGQAREHAEAEALREVQAMMSDVQG